MSYIYTTLKNPALSFLGAKVDIHDIELFKPAVLLVEDDELTKKIEAFALHAMGCEVDTANNAETALEALEKPYDLIVLDVGLPDQSGVRLAEDIRRGRTKQKYSTPIVIVSTFAEATDRQRYLNAGVDEVLAKPMDHERVKKLLFKLIEKQKSH
jgi:DNA-binding response OmpR family regulator